MLNHFETKSVGWTESPAYERELEDFRRTKEKMDRERNAREAAEKKIKDEQEATELKRLERIKERKEAVAYSDPLAQEICERLSCGELLISVLLDEHLPSIRKCNQWLRDHAEFNLLYQSALGDRLKIFEEQVIQIADDMAHDFRTIVKNGREKRVADPEMVARARLRIEVRFRHPKAGMPSKWGDVSTLNVKSSDQFDTSNLSPDELEKDISEIERKSFISRKVA